MLTRVTLYSPYQDLSQSAITFAIYKFLCIRQLNIHVGVDAYELAMVFSLAPLEAYNDRLVDSMSVGDLAL